MNYQDPRDGGRRRAQGNPSQRRSVQGNPSQRRSVQGDRPQRYSAQGNPRQQRGYQEGASSRRSVQGQERRQQRMSQDAGRDQAYLRAEQRPAPRSSSMRQTPRPATNPSMRRAAGRATAPAAYSYNRKKSPNWLAVAAGALVIALFAFAVVKLPSVISPKQPEVTAEQAAAAAEAEKKAAAERQAALDAAATPVTFTMSFTGDCTLGNDINFGYDGRLPQYYDENGPHYFFQNVKSIFDSDDYTVVDMEGTFTTSEDRSDNFFAFKADPSYVEILKYGGAEAATLANNHSHDYYEDGYRDTWRTLEDAGIVPFGYDDIAYVDIKGVKVALIGVYELDEYLGIMDNMLANIQKAKDNGATVTIVFQHWGEEKMYVPDTDQVTLGHAAIDAGADLVIGCHPHRVQGIEEYNGRYIAYSMGNFCFGGNNAPADMDCYIFQQTFTVKGKTVETNGDGAINVIPCSISSAEGFNNYQPTPATGAEADRIMAKIDEISQEIPKI